MKKEISLNGYGYRIRPVVLDDAAFIIDVRLEDEQRNKYIHKISRDIKPQQEWITKYLEREDDYYFVVENNLTQKPEGLISIYNIKNKKAEWGRWVIKQNSLAAIESVDLVFKVAFNILNLTELYSQTVADNTAVVGFHNALPQMYRATLKDHFELNGQKYDAVEHYTTKEYYYETLQEKLEGKAFRIFERGLKQLVGDLKFHHIGVATNNIETELSTFKMLGYKREGAPFTDLAQGITGLFLISPNQPRIELLSNLEGSTTLDYYLKNKIKMYHFAYLTQDIKKALDGFNTIKTKVISPLKKSTYFKKNICFLLQPNRFMIELIEEAENADKIS